MNLSYGFRVVEAFDVVEREGDRYGHRYRRQESRLSGEEESEGHSPDHTSAEATRCHAPERRPQILPGFLDDGRLRRSPDIGKREPLPDEK